MKLPTSRIRCGLTVVELLTVISILAILTGMMLPAVQKAREAARRITCAKNLSQQSLALLAFESNFGKFPAGAEADTLHAWSTRILPYLEQTSIYQQIDFSISWDAPANIEWSRQHLVVFSCPSSWKDYPGSTDYSGMSGSSNNTTTDIGRNGVLFPVSRNAGRISLAEITDGLSNTIAVAEAVAIGEQDYGLWASGMNCISHDNGPINNRSSGNYEIASLHPGGANATFADGSVRFLSESLSLDVVSALCTRNNQEIVFDF